MNVCVLGSGNEKTCVPDILALTMNPVDEIKNPPASDRREIESQTSQLHPGQLAVLRTNADVRIRVELVDDQAASHSELKLPQLQFPQFYLHGNVDLQIQGNAALLPLRIERGDHVAGDLDAASSKRDVQDGGVFVALVERRQGTSAELRAGVRNSEMAAVEIIYADLLVRIPGPYLHIELGIDGEIRVDAEVGDLDAVDGVFGGSRLEYQIQNATGNGDGRDERE